MALKQYTLKSEQNKAGYPKGTVFYEYRGFDRGQAAKSTVATGVEHISVTENDDGSGPYITFPLHELRNILDPAAAVSLEAPCGPRQYVILMRMAIRPGGAK